MRIIFLDVDGVLNNEETTDRYQGWIGIDPLLVDKLKEIYNDSNKKEETRIVITSSWRYEKIKKFALVDGSYDYLLGRLKDAGLEVIGCTDMDKQSGWYRGREINKWLEDNKDKNVSTFVILDDEFFDFEIRNLLCNLVRINSVLGIIQADIDRALKILNGEEVEPVDSYS